MGFFELKTGLRGSDRVPTAPITKGHLYFPLVDECKSSPRPGARAGGHTLPCECHSQGSSCPLISAATSQQQGPPDSQTKLHSSPALGIGHERKKLSNYC